MKHIRTSAAIGAVLALSLGLTGCGSSAQETVTTKDNNELITIDFFDSLANKAGTMKGWFAKYVKDKFNIKINLISPIVSGGGDTLFDTRSAAGNVGDIIIVPSQKMKKLLKAKLVSDMTPYMKDAKNLKRLSAASKNVNKAIGAKSGVWGFPQQVAIGGNPTQSSQVVDPDNAPYIRWDYYREIGYPEIKNLDDYISVLKKMQDKARQDTGQNDIYAITLFKDWDDNLMRQGSDFAQMFGYQRQHNVFFKPEGGKVESPLDKDGIYQKMLQFLFKANQAGIVDPESSSQNWDKLVQKVTEGKTLSMFDSYVNWTQNTPDNLKKGVGMFLAPLQNMSPFSTGYRPTGDPGQVIALGAKAKNKARAVKFIDWLYSSDFTWMNNAVPKDLAWKLNDKGQPTLTEFGERSAFSANGLNMPESWGGGSYVDGNGAQTINFPAVNGNSIDPETKESFNVRVWKTQLAKPLDPTTQDWSNRMDGAKNTMQYLEKTGKSTVAPGVSFSPAEAPSQLSVVMGQIDTKIISHSWKAVMAKNQAEYDKEIDAMISEAEGLGYKDVLKFDTEQVTNWRKAMKQVADKYAK